MLIALKIDVDTYRGTKEGTLNLVRMLQRHQADASFLFSLGPDHTGWAIRRAFRPGFFQKVSRTSILKHYGLKTLMQGVLLPAPDIGKRCADQMRTVHAAGFECGIHSWDHVVWQDNVRERDAAWTIDQMQRSYDRFTDIFGAPPATHGAAGWQMNETALAQLDAWGMEYASDGRAGLAADGSLLDADAGPYRILGRSGAMRCVQLPTTLPTLDEMLGRIISGKRVDETNASAAILRLTEAPRDHVFTLHAELEGGKLAPIFERLLEGWQAQGYRLVSMAGHYRKVKNISLPEKRLDWREVPGRSGSVMAG